jgi:hypothetical protein
MKHLSFAMVAAIVAIATIANAGVQECRQRCDAKRDTCLGKCSSTPKVAECNGPCYTDHQDCYKDCDANAK